MENMVYGWNLLYLEDEKDKRKKMETGQVWEDLISDYPNIFKLHKIQKYDTILGRSRETPRKDWRLIIFPLA